MRLLHFQYTGKRYLKTNKQNYLHGSAPREISKKRNLLNTMGEEWKTSFTFRRLRETDDPDSSSFFCLLPFGLVCFVHSSLLLPDHKASQGHGAQRETLRRSGGPGCLSTGKEGERGRWSHKSAWAGLREFEGQWFTGSTEGPPLPRPARRNRFQASPPPPPTTPASVHPPTQRPVRFASGNKALWSPIMEDVWLLRSLLNLGSDLQGCLCNPNITDTWRRWKVELLVFPLALLPPVERGQLWETSAPLQTGGLFCNMVVVRPQPQQPCWLGPRCQHASFSGWQLFNSLRSKRWILQEESSKSVISTKLIKHVMLESKPWKVARHQRLKTNGLIQSSQMLWAGDTQSPFWPIPGCFLPKCWYKQRGKWVVFVKGNRCSQAHNYMPYTEKNSRPYSLVAQRMGTSWAWCTLHKRVFWVPLHEAFIWGYDCSQGTMRADRVPVIVINERTQIRVLGNTWEAG